MDLEKIKQLMAVMDEYKMKRLVLKDAKGEEIELEKESLHSFVEREAKMAMPVEQHIRQPENMTAAPNKEAAGHLITSPMVGTFYSSPSPDEAAFVQVGDTVNAETVVCIIEAMKVMNEVKAGKSGKIAEVYLESAHPVEYGTKLFRIVE